MLKTAVGPNVMFRETSQNSSLVPLKSVVETERKLAVEADFRLPTLTGHPLPRRVFKSTYFDTLDHCLARSSITLRRRLESGAPVWQMKLPLQGARREIELRELSMAPPTRLVDALIILLEGKHLVPIAELQTARTGVQVREGKDNTVEVVLDTVSVLREGSVIQRFKELEIESLNGNEEGIERLATSLYEVGARHHDGRPKLFRALSLAFQPLDEPGSHASMVEQIRYSLLRQLQQLKQCDPGVRLDGDIEGVHRIRVAARRMRTVLLSIRKLAAPEWVDPLLSGLKWLSEVFARVRDLDVQMEYFRREAEQLKARDRRPLDRFLRHLQSDRDQAHQTLLDEMKSARYVGFVSKLRDAAEAPAVINSEYTLRDAAARQFRKLRKTVRSLKGSPSNADLHQVRIKAKRARYAAELASENHGKAIGRFIKAAGRLQDLLGIHQDAVLAERYVEGFLKYQGRRQAAFTAGLLAARAKQRREEVREQFWSQWKRLKKRGVRAWEA
jgi:CHAD domain-containing protein